MTHDTLPITAPLVAGHWYLLRLIGGGFTLRQAGNDCAVSLLGCDLCVDVTVMFGKEIQRKRESKDRKGGNMNDPLRDRVIYALHLLKETSDDWLFVGEEPYANGIRRAIDCIAAALRITSEEKDRIWGTEHD